MLVNLVSAHLEFYYYFLKFLFYLSRLTRMNLFYLNRFLLCSTENTRYSAVLVFTYMLLECVSPTTLAEVGLCGFCTVYVSLGRN